MGQTATYTGMVREVISGDDLIILVDLGVEGLWVQRRVRLLGVDTPDARHKSYGTEAGRIRDRVKSLVKNRTVALAADVSPSGKWVATVYFETDKGTCSLNELLISEGYVYRRDASERA